MNSQSRRMCYNNMIYIFIRCNNSYALTLLQELFHFFTRERVIPPLSFEKYFIIIIPTFKMGHFLIRYRRICLSDQFRILNTAVFRHTYITNLLSGSIKKVFFCQKKSLIFKYVFDELIHKLMTFRK